MIKFKNFDIQMFADGKVVIDTDLNKNGLLGRLNLDAVFQQHVKSLIEQDNAIQ